MFFDDLKLGHSFDLAPAKIEKQQMLDFARLYDNVPLHTDENYAKNTVFGKIIASGVMSFMVVWAKYLEVDLFGEQLLAGKSTKIEWLKPVFADDILTGKCTITKLTPRNEKNGTVELTINVFNQHGVLVLINVTEAVVKREITQHENKSLTMED